MPQVNRARSMLMWFSPDSDAAMTQPSHIIRLSAALLLFLWTTPCICQQQTRNILCHEGDGVFDAEFSSGITVHVGATRGRGPTTLAIRACSAKLNWDEQELFVAKGASQLDLDAFGVDMGDGIPVAAFQIKKADSDCCANYQIYSLEKPPRLLRTITGGGFFSAADMDLDGSVEIWTNDAAAVDGFESVTLGELDTVPTVVFRFSHGLLIDVSADFQPYFDNEIARMRADIRDEDLRDFKDSDGKLTATKSVSPERLHQLRTVKIKVLEIVWAYLYSGREQDAWRSLTEMWPSADIGRIRVELENARKHGIHGQADRTWSGRPARDKKKHAQIFDAVSRSGPGSRLEVVPPKAILLQRPPTSEIPRQDEQELVLDLIVDKSGKVRSADPTGKMKSVDPQLVNAALTWKFIPAFKDGRPVASRLRIAVSPRQ
jgi:hypothetical protein